jgi:hypothetical protein
MKDPSDKKVCNFTKKYGLPTSAKTFKARNPKTDKIVKIMTQTTIIPTANVELLIRLYSWQEHLNYAINNEDFKYALISAKMVVNNLKKIVTE